MDESNWRNLYAYLLRTLQINFREIGIDSSLLVDLELVSRIRVQQSKAHSSSTQVNKKLREDLELERTRALESKEIFEAAMQIIASRLVELPLITSALSQNLGKDKNQILWKADSEERETIFDDQNFSAENFCFSPQEEKEIKTALREIEKLAEINILKWQPNQNFAAR